MLKKQRFPTIELHSDDATSRGINQGDWVRVWNDRGEAFFKADIRDTVAAGVACHVSLWWRRYSPVGWNCNVLTSDAAADMGGGATFHTNLVQAEPATNKLSNHELEAICQLFPIGAKQLHH